MEQVIIAIVVIVVIIVVVSFVINLDLLGKLKILIPGFGNDDKIFKGNVYEEIYLDKEGRCKPIEGVYSLMNDNLEVWDGTKWVNIKDQLPSENSLRNKEIRDNLVNFVSDIEIDYKGEKYDVVFSSLGFEITLKNIIYIYVPINSLYKKMEFGFAEPKLLLPNSKNNIPFTGVNSQEVLDSFLFAFSKFSYPTKIYYNRGTEVSTLGRTPKRVGRMFAYFEDPQTRIRYGIDFTNKFYQFSNSNKNYLAFADWHEISEINIATNLEYNLMETKNILVKECENEK